jgi:spore coat protein U domain-containing protein, fimbrial subunit CupE1/2/3/6
MYRFTAVQGQGRQGNTVMARAVIAARPLAIAAVICGLANGGAEAATATASFTVSVTITASCAISAGNLAFGSQGVLSADVDSTSTIAVTCTNSTPYSVGLDNGLSFSGGTRRMKDTGAGTTYVNFGLYTDSARSNAWTTSTSAASCTGGANTCALGTGNGASQNITVYGRIPTQTTPAPATFNDTVTATITY